MTNIVGTIKNSGGEALTGELEVTLDSALIDASMAGGTARAREGRPRQARDRLACLVVMVKSNAVVA